MALDWLPSYPHRFARREVRGMSVTVQNLSPIPNPLPPTELTWHPTYPDWLAKPKRLLAQQSYFHLDGLLFFDMRWSPTYPSRIVRKTYHPAYQRAHFAPDPAILRVPVTGGWRPTFPSYIWRKPPLVGGQSIWRVDPLTLLTSATCVEWDETSVVRPTIDTEVLSRSTMTCDVHDAGFLLLEDGGFLLLEDGGKILLEDQTGCVQEALTRSTMDEEDVC